MMVVSSPYRHKETFALHQKHLILKICLLLLAYFLQTTAQAQSEVRRLEVGGHFIMMGKFDAIDRSAGELTEEVDEFTKNRNLGVGGRFTVNLTRYLAIETEWNALPQINEYTGRKSQWFYGPKLGIRKNSFGIFAKARPGYMYMGRDFCQSYPPFEENYRCLGTYKKNPAIDVGGVLEFYPKSQAIVRMDIGDTIVHFNHINRYRPELGPDFNVATQVFGGTTHSLQVTIGVGYRF
jgi:hypothetical protein